MSRLQLLLCLSPIYRDAHLEGSLGRLTTGVYIEALSIVKMKSRMAVPHTAAAPLGDPFTLGPDDQAFFQEHCRQVLKALQLNYNLNADGYLLVQEALYNSKL